MRQIHPCARCERVLFCNRAGYCDSCRKQLIAYGAKWAPMKPARRSLPSAKKAA